jgi:ferredoxin-thioredoxin reductase catalytic subunit
LTPPPSPNDEELVVTDTLAANNKELTAVITLTVNNEDLVVADTLATDQEGVQRRHCPCHYQDLRKRGTC